MSPPSECASVGAIAGYAYVPGCPSVNKHLRGPLRAAWHICACPDEPRQFPPPCSTIRLLLLQNHSNRNSGASAVEQNVDEPIEHGEPPCCHERRPRKGCRCCCHDEDQDGERLPRLSAKYIAPRLPDYMVDEYKQEQLLSRYPAKGCHPHRRILPPWSAVLASLMVIIGYGFTHRQDLNTVAVGDIKSLVVTAERHRLIVICDFKIQSGPVRIKTHHGVA